MAEVGAEILPSVQKHPVSESLGIPEKTLGKPIGTLIVCGQGPVQDSSTKINLENLDKAMPGAVSGHEANTWMRLNARAAGVLNSENDIGLIITSGKNTGGKYVEDGKEISPTEAELMRNIIENVYDKNAEVALEKEAKNTLFNIINAANIIDAKREVNPNDPNLDNVWIMGSQFHGPRLKILASLFGFDPSHVLSAEKVLTTSSQLKQQQRLGDGPKVFDRQEALQKLIKVRLTGEQINEEGQNYFERKQERAGELLDRTMDKYLKEKNVSESEIPARKEEIKKKLFIEEQKSAQTRMKDERRWVRGLAMEADYVLPYSAYLKSDVRLKDFLLKFDAQTLQKYSIERGELEGITPETTADVIKKIRSKIDPNRWSWQVVKEEWKDQEYPPEVKQRFASLNVPEGDIESLSKAEVPAVDERARQIEKEKASIKFLRHAPTDWNREGKIQGNVQTNVIPEGVADYLKKSGADAFEKPDMIVVSGLNRTSQTAEALMQLLNWQDLLVIKNGAFNERKWGILEGKTHEEARQLLISNPEIIQKYPYFADQKTFEQIWNDQTFRPEGGELLGEVKERAEEGILELARLYPGKKLLVITHAGVLQNVQ